MTRASGHWRSLPRNLPGFVVGAALALSWSGSALPAAAQAAPPADTVPPVDSITPAGAFARALVLPGWGHAVIGEHNRGVTYFVLEGLSFFMLAKSWSRLDDAREAEQVRVGAAEAEALAAGITDPFEIQQFVDAHEGVQRARGLVGSREDQREDWIALGVFFVFVSGVDAFVSAHLQDFPAPITIEPNVEGSVSVGVAFPLPIR